MRRRETAGGRRDQFLKAAWPGLASWLVLFVVLALEPRHYFLSLIHACLLATSAWGLWWMIIAIKRRSVTTGLGVLVTLSYPVLLLLVAPQFLTRYQLLHGL